MKKYIISFIMLVTLIVATATPYIANAEATDGDSMVRIFHASPDAPEVDVYVDGKPVVEGAGFKDMTDYIMLHEGNYTVDVYKAGTQEEILVDQAVAIEANKAYNIAVINKLENIEMNVVENSIDVPLNKTMVRVGHLSPDAQAVDVRMVGGDSIFQDLTFGEVTSYVTLDPGTYNLEVVTTGGTAVLDLSDTALAANQIYTVYAVNVADMVEAMVVTDYTMVPGMMPSTGLGGSAHSMPSVPPLFIGLLGMIVWSFITLFKKIKSA
ncbi:DUF4397 domain-containing protein [Bacillus sp. FJAT-45066]|uniref:DUF4397 domain-containing protein n=1 Tax=Bacillus sp. FJAT-45066 TaxID=2011010 RepID=UPI001596904C|nr:DUF4397 domain-containing protein [Bacillus sp. FJAT-45066]